MAQKIEFIWECPACLHGNKVEIRKPSHTSPSLFSAKCLYCKSVAQVKVVLRPGYLGQLSYYFTDLQLSTYGEAKATKRLNEEKQTTPHDSETTKGK